MQVHQINIKAVLWEYYTRNDGQFTIRLRLTNYKDVEYVKTGYTSHPNNWDEENGKPLTSHPAYQKILDKIKELSEEIEFEIKLAKKNHEPICLKEIKRKVEKNDFDQDIRKVPSVDIWQFYKEHIKSLNDSDQCGGADIFETNMKIFMQIFDNKPKSFKSFNSDDCKKIEDRIKKLSQTSKSIYLRTFYRIWNLAIAKKIIPEKLHPKYSIEFHAYKTIKTRKRAVPIETIPEMNNLTFPYESRLFRSLLMAKFIYYARGMNFGDAINLKLGEHISKGYCKYKRAKNRRAYDFKLHPEAVAVVEELLKYPMRSDAGYIFPILDSSHDTARKRHTRKKSALKDFNEDLKAIEKETNCPAHMTSYVLRHSVLSHLKKRYVDISIIKEVAGHETEEQSNVYLQDIEDGTVAEFVEEALPVKDDNNSGIKKKNLSGQHINKLLNIKKKYLSIASTTDKPEKGITNDEKLEKMEAIIIDLVLLCTEVVAISS